MADGSVGLLSTGHGGVRLLVLLAHSGLLRGWLGARVLERRETGGLLRKHFCASGKKKKKESKNETRRSEKSVGQQPWPS